MPNDQNTQALSSYFANNGSSYFGGAGATQAITAANKGFAGAPGAMASIFNDPHFATLMQLLQPGANGLSSNLSQMLGIGMGKLDASEGANVASAKTDALGRGLEGSTIEQAGISGAQAAGEQAKASLLASILGMQTGQTQQLGQDIFSGINTDVGGQNALIANFLQFLTGNVSDAANIDMFNQGESDANMLADRSRQTQTISDVLGLFGNGAKAFAAMK